MPVNSSRSDFFERVATTGSANTNSTVSTSNGRVRKLRQVTVKYSAAPTQTGVTITINSGAGAAYDTLVITGSANAQNTFYSPDSDLILLDDDVVDVLAPAGGVGITAATTIITEVV